MATVSAPAKRARRLRPAPLWLSLLLAFLAYFLLDFSLRLFYGSMSNVSLWAAVGVHAAVVGHDDGDRCAAAANGPAHLPAGHVRAVCAAGHHELRALQADGHVLFLCRPCLCRRRRAVYQRVLLPSEERRVVQSRRLHGHDALRRDLHAEGAPWPPRPDRGRRAGGRVRGGHRRCPQCAGVPGR